MSLQQSLTVERTKLDDEVARGFNFETNGGVPPFNKTPSPTHVVGHIQANNLDACRVFSFSNNNTTVFVTSKIPTLMDLVEMRPYSNTMTRFLNMDLDTELSWKQWWKYS